MSKPVPLAYGVYYHIYNRGNNREDIFFEERNYRHFLNLYAKYIEPVADTYAYCLLPNHFHFLVRIKDEETLTVIETLRVLVPSQQFSNLFNAYAKAINKAYGHTGSLFENPFGRIRIDSDAYFKQLVAYIHRNPQKHHWVDDFRNWPYSSYHGILSSQPSRLRRADVLDWFQGAEHFKAMHQVEVTEVPISSLILEDLD